MEGLIFGILRYLKNNKSYILPTPLQNSEEFVKNQALINFSRQVLEIGQNLRNDLHVDMCSILADIANYHLNS